MKTNLLYISFLCLLLSAPIYGQKAKDKRVDIKYIALPEKKLPPEFTTYSVSVYGSNASLAGTTNSLAESVKMYAFKRVSGKDYGHLRISVNTGWAQCGSASLKSKTTTSKDKDGKETKTTTYWYERSCTSAASYKIIDPEGNELAVYSSPFMDAVKSREGGSPSQITSDYSAMSEQLRRSFASSVANQITSMAKGRLTKLFDFAPASDSPQFYFIKKHADEDAFEAKLATTIDIFKAASHTTPASETMSKMQNAIDLWKKYSEQNPGDDKDLIEVYIACNSNLANTYYYLDQIELAEKHAKRILSVDKDKRTSRLLEDIAVTKERMALHGINTMHYERDIANAVPPSKVKEVAEEIEELQEDNNSIAGKIVRNGETVDGFFVRSKEDGDFMFGPGGNTKFFLESPSSLKEQDLTSSEVTAFSIGERNFRKQSFTPCAKGKGTQGSHILEELYVADKIRLYKYYPVSGALAGDKPEFAFQKAGEEAPVSVYDTKFLLWEKGLAGYFGDCADLKDMCTAGNFKLEETDLLKAVRVYAEVCP